MISSVKATPFLLPLDFHPTLNSMPKAVSRPAFPTSSTDFALPPSSSNLGASSSLLTLEDGNPLLPRFRRPSLLAPKASYMSESRLHSPLAASFTLHSSSRRRGRQNSTSVEESESDRERMRSDSSPSSSSENPTPPLKVPDNSDEDLSKTISKPPRTPPPRRKPSTAIDVQEPHPIPLRRLSFPLKQPRILNLLAESRPEENEVKSEAAFQRLITSCSELPTQPRTPRNISDRGRYPEEAVEEDFQREETPSDDGEAEDGPFAFSYTGGSEPMNIQKPRTPASSVNGDDLNMSLSASPSIGSLAMDVDMPSGSPSMSSMSSTPINHWRYTPPPTTSAVRSNKRKLDDRFDPYPSASKRRAVSPSLSHLRDIHPNNGSPMGTRNPRLPISLPITIPSSAVSSATSSPTITGTYPTTIPRTMNITSSPTSRATIGLSSPILRPVPRVMRRGDGEEKEIEGAGEAVGGLTLG
ncbi:hypothetical protein BD779DRAFT_1486386 [Infundibulicybe gibba]|nr:hypothetical protein BD779DRAFT_1486386 [Infundibulicybe gibba]